MTSDPSTTLSDIEKLRLAFAQVTASFGSVEAVLEAFGLAQMPTAQKYGIFFGIIVFICTVSAVIILLIVGGSFRRIQEQAETGEPTLKAPHEARSQRALLLETLLEARKRLASKYNTSNDVVANTDPDTAGKTQALTHTKSSTTHTPLSIMLQGDVPDPNNQNYTSNYRDAYHKAHDKPGGATLSGRPEARTEAYARAFASCGTHTQVAYRRSYARLYESVCCHNHATDEHYQQLYEQRPQDIVGKYIHLEAMSVERHLKDLYLVLSGQNVILEHGAYDANQVWAFQPQGPFYNAQEMESSFVFQRKNNEAAFCIVQAVTNTLIGCILVTHDDPEHLSIQLELPLLPPKLDGRPEQLEACFLLMDRLFAHGYRRIQVLVDSQDVVAKKCAARTLGCTLEGVLSKHKIVKDANRDSNVYSMLNSDWNQGGRRATLYSKLYGAKQQMVDAANEKSEQELDARARAMAKKKI